MIFEHIYANLKKLFGNILEENLKLCVYLGDIDQTADHLGTQRSSWIDLRILKVSRGFLTSRKQSGYMAGKKILLYT